MYAYYRHIGINGTTRRDNKVVSLLLRPIKRKSRRNERMRGLHAGIPVEAWDVSGCLELHHVPGKEMSSKWAWGWVDFLTDSFKRGCIMRILSMGFS